jgi:hypothetical protein
MTYDEATHRWAAWKLGVPVETIHDVEFDNGVDCGTPTFTATVYFNDGDPEGRGRTHRTIWNLHPDTVIRELFDLSDYPPT